MPFSHQCLKSLTTLAKHLKSAEITVIVCRFTMRLCYTRILLELSLPCTKVSYHKSAHIDQYFDIRYEKPKSEATRKQYYTDVITFFNYTKGEQLSKELIIRYKEMLQEHSF